MSTLCELVNQCIYCAKQARLLPAGSHEALAALGAVYEADRAKVCSCICLISEMPLRILLIRFGLKQKRGVRPDQGSSWPQLIDSIHCRM